MPYPDYGTELMRTEPTAVVQPNLGSQLTSSVMGVDLSTPDIDKMFPVNPPPATSNKIDRIAMALGNAGAAVMGRHKDSWQAQLGTQVAQDSQRTIYGKALARAVAGGEIKAEELEGLSPEQSTMIFETKQKVEAQRFDKYTKVVSIGQKFKEMQLNGLLSEAESKAAMQRLVTELGGRAAEGAANRASNEKIQSAQDTTSRDVAKIHADATYAGIKEQARQFGLLHSGDVALQTALAQATDMANSLPPETDSDYITSYIRETAKELYKNSGGDVMKVDWKAFGATSTTAGVITYDEKGNRTDAGAKGTVEKKVGAMKPPSAPSGPSSYEKYGLPGLTEPIIRGAGDLGEAVLRGAGTLSPQLTAAEMYLRDAAGNIIRPLTDAELAAKGFFGYK